MVWSEPSLSTGSEGSSHALLLGSQSWTINSNLYICGTCFQSGNQVENFLPVPRSFCVMTLEIIQRVDRFLISVFQIKQKLNDISDPC